MGAAVGVGRRGKRALSPARAAVAGLLGLGLMLVAPAAGAHRGRAQAQSTFSGLPSASPESRKEISDRRGNP
jgi:hypothetical protein